MFSLGEEYSIERIKLSLSPDPYIRPLYYLYLAVEIHDPKGFGRTRMRYIPDASSSMLYNLTALSALMVGVDTMI